METVSFDKDKIEKVLSLNILGDDKAEFLEDFILSVRSNNLAIENRDIKISILDDDIGVYLTRKSLTINEGDCSKNTNCHLNPTRQIQLPTIKLNNIPATERRVDYELIEGTAKKNIDFKPLQGTLIFSPTSPKEVNLTMEIYTDLLEEEDKTLKLQLSSSSDLEILSGELNITIKNDDTYPTIQLYSFSPMHEDNNYLGDIYPYFRLSKPPKLDFNLSYSYTDDTAYLGDDYTLVGSNNRNGVVEILAGNSVDYNAKAFRLVADKIEEKPNTEKFYIKFNDTDYSHFQVNGSGNVLNRIEVNIIDDDIIPTISDTELSIDETDYSRKEFLQINMNSTNINNKFPVHYKIEANTALENDDYILDYNGSFGTAYVEPNANKFYIPINIIGDRIDETKESFKLTIFNINTSKLKVPFDDNATSTEIIVYINDEKDPIPLNCKSDLYLSSTFDYSTSKNIYNKMFLYTIDISEEIFSFIKKDPKDGVGYLYNALGYNSNDNFLYAMYFNEVYRIGSDKNKKSWKD